jgi:hypothetical protein
MPKAKRGPKPKLKRRAWVTVNLGEDHCGRLDECIAHFLENVPVEERRRVWGFRVITRSAMIRMAIDALYSALIRGDRPAPRAK